MAVSITKSSPVCIAEISIRIYPIALIDKFPSVAETIEVRSEFLISFRIGVKSNVLDQSTWLVESITLSNVQDSGLQIMAATTVNS